MNTNNVIGYNCKTATHQRGLSLMALLIAIAFIGFAMIYGAKIGVIYFDQMSVKKALKDSAIELSSKESATVATFKSAVLRRISLDNIKMDGEDMTVTKSGGVWTAEVSFVKDVPITDRVRLVLDLSFSGEYGK